MANLIDKDALVAKIEKKIKQYEMAFDNPLFASYEASLIAKGKYRKLLDILQFIDTLKVMEIGVDFGDPEGDKSAKYIIDTKTLEVKDLQEEPVSKDYRERYKRIAESEEFRKNYDGMSIGDIVPVEEQEPASENLEKIVEEIAEPTILNAYGTKELARRLRNTICGTFVSEDLGEYINELSKQFPEVSFAKLSRIAVRVAKWQKQQMMAKAIDGDITFDYYGDDDKTYGCIAQDSFCLEDFGLKDRDKVKMILIKDDKL